MRKQSLRLSPREQCPQFLWAQRNGDGGIFAQTQLDCFDLYKLHAVHSIIQDIDMPDMSLWVCAFVHSPPLKNPCTAVYLVWSVCDKMDKAIRSIPV